MITGSCLCKKVSYQVAELQGPLVYCHCSFCRKATSSAFSANSLVKAADFQLGAGSPDLAVYESSPGKFRYYCPDCHSQIYHTKDDMPDLITLKLGTIDNCEQDLSELPIKHIHDEEGFAWLEYERSE